MIYYFSIMAVSNERVVNIQCAPTPSTQTTFASFGTRQEIKQFLRQYH